MCKNFCSRQRSIAQLRRRQVRRLARQRPRWSDGGDLIAKQCVSFLNHRFSLGNSSCFIPPLLPGYSRRASRRGAGRLAGEHGNLRVKAP